MTDGNGQTRSAMREGASPSLMALSSLVTRAGLASQLGKSFGGDRDIYETFGYKKNPTFNDYWNHYQRSDIAAKIVDLPASTTWRRTPEITVEGEESDFPDKIMMLDDRVWLFHYLERLDRLAGIGRYAVLLVGIQGDSELEKPLGSTESETETTRANGFNPARLIYLSVFSEANAEVVEWEEDTGHPRFGRPKFYRLQLSGNKDSNDISQNDTDIKSIEKKVHWSRVLHFADGLLEDDVYGTPRLKKVLNRLEDLQKLVGGSAEMFWQNVAGIWHADIDPDVSVSPDEMTEFDDQLQEAMHGLRRILQTRGVDLSMVGGGTPDPSGSYEVIRQLTSASAEIPERVLFGSERGQLAGDQDRGEWHGRIKSRQEQVAEPSILRPLFQLLHRARVVQLPADGYDVMWPSLDEPTEKDKAEAAKSWLEAAKAGAPGGSVDLVLPPWEVRERFLELPSNIPAPPENWAGTIQDVPPNGGSDDEGQRQGPPNQEDGEGEEEGSVGSTG